MHFVIVGAGAWGTAVALHLARAGCEVTLVPRRESQARDLAARRENLDYLPGQVLPPEIRIVAEREAPLARAEVILLACPAQALRETCGRLRDAIGSAGDARLIVSLAKGLELGTHLRPTEVIAAALTGFPVAALAGPTNALGVARGDPSAMVLASARVAGVVQAVQAAISSPTLRVYTSDDLPGL